MTRADCTVRALASVAEITYALAEEIAADAGRKPGRRFKAPLVIEQAKARGIRFRKLRFSGKTLSKFIRQHPTGRYYLRKTGHALAVVDGKPSDGTGLGSIITHAWQLTKESSWTSTI